MARCTHCGATVKARSRSCEYCGTRLEVGAFESVLGLADDRFKQRDAVAAAAREAAAERERIEAKNRPKWTLGWGLVMAASLFMLIAMSWNERQWQTAIIIGCVLLATLAVVAFIVWQVRRPKTPPVVNQQATAQPAPIYQAPAPPTPSHQAATPPAPSVQAPAPPAGWYPDPTSRHQYRYWGGNTWATTVCDGDAVSEDPI